MILISKDEITKRALANSLKELTKNNSLEKITIKDISEHCGVNRQTFYYHFHDKFDLINWIYYSEAVESISDYSNYDHWSKAIHKIFIYLSNNKTFYIKALKMDGQNSFSNYLFNITHEIIKKVVDDTVQTQEMNVTEKEKNFVADFYTHALTGLTVQWIKDGLQETPESLTERIRDMIDGSVINTLSRYEKKS